MAVFSEFWECSQNSRSRLPYTAPFVLLTTKHHNIFNDWGRGCLSQGEGGAKRKVQIKRESLPTDTSGGVIPSRPSRSCTYLYRLRQGGSYTKWPLMSYLNKEFRSMV